MILVVSNFGFEGGTVVLIVPVPGHGLPFAFRQKESLWSVLPIQMLNHYENTPMYIH